MAEGKKSVLLYCDLIHTIEKMDDKTAGEFFKHYLRYINDLNPETDNPLIDITFESVKQNLKRDLKKWDSIREKRSKAGIASAKKRQQKATNSTRVKSVQQTSTNPTVNVNGNVTVNDTVTVPTDVGVYVSIEKLKEKYLSNEKICNAVINNKKNKIANHGRLENLLTEFNEHLESTGQHSKEFNDYTSHFLNWNRKDKTDKNQSKPLTLAEKMRQDHGITST